MAAPSALLTALLSCTGTTGYQLVTFYAAGEGAADAQPGQPYTFSYAYGTKTFEVSLTKAVIHVGAIYLDESLPTAGSAEISCTLPGTYVGEVRAGRDIDMLDPKPQPFPALPGTIAPGIGSTIPAAIGQIWLSGPDVNSTAPQTAPQSILPDVLEIEGSATDTSNGKTVSFAGALSIDQGNSNAPINSALPGTNPLCAARIVTPIYANVALSQSGTLILRLDPKALFLNADLAELPTPAGHPPTSILSNTGNLDQPSYNLRLNLKSSAPYRFEWQPATP